ncbi:MAG: hypothetical protein K5829_04520 [Treponema sp.]|nr:hypothetical protein [Treponema sp.]
MDIKAVFSDIKDKILSLFEKISDYCRENKKMAIIISSLIVLILILIIILVSTMQGKKKPESLEMPLILSEERLIPNGPETQNNYTISRKTEKEWSEEESDQWFTIPSDKEIDSLNKTNEAIVSDILGVAP